MYSVLSCAVCYRTLHCTALCCAVLPPPMSHINSAIHPSSIAHRPSSSSYPAKPDHSDGRLYPSSCMPREPSLLPSPPLQSLHRRETSFGLTPFFFPSAFLPPPRLLLLYFFSNGSATPFVCRMQRFLPASRCSERGGARETCLILTLLAFFGKTSLPSHIQSTKGHFSCVRINGDGHHYCTSIRSRQRRGERMSQLF
jgi:hypothetical protein